MRIKKMINCLIGIGCFIILAAGPVVSATINVTVDGKSLPWDYNSSLNTSYAYGINDGTDPTVVDSDSSGISFAAGGVLEISYLGGSTTANYSNYPAPDANGCTGYITKSWSSFPATVNDAPGSSGSHFPTLYMALPADATAKYYLNALVGTFTDDSGVIVGTPFHIGNGIFIEIPTGATQLQLGINDDIFYDNTGSLQISVKGPNVVPVPGAFYLLGSGLLGLAGWRRFRKS